MSSSSPLRPAPNQLETAILKRLPPDGVTIETEKLHVLSREITGAGSYTTFAVPAAQSEADRSQVGLNKLIELPGVPNGLGAVLWLRAGVPQCLEIYTFGSDNWDGSYEGFKIV